MAESEGNESVTTFFLYNCSHPNQRTAGAATKRAKLHGANSHQPPLPASQAYAREISRGSTPGKQKCGLCRSPSTTPYGHQPSNNRRGQREGVLSVRQLGVVFEGFPLHYEYHSSSQVPFLGPSRSPGQANEDKEAEASKHASKAHTRYQRKEARGQNKGGCGTRTQSVQPSPRNPRASQETAHNSTLLFAVFAPFRLAKILSPTIFSCHAMARLILTYHKRQYHKCELAHTRRKRENKTGD